MKQEHTQLVGVSNPVTVVTNKSSLIWAMKQEHTQLVGVSNPVTVVTNKSS